jgi:restriction system protein
MMPPKPHNGDSDGLVEITPKEYERQVLEWVEGSEDRISDVQVSQRDLVEGDSGEYEIDVHAELSLFQGAQLKVLIECKRWSHPVPRDELLTLKGKLEDIGAHKGMMFTTSRFQRGALNYAKTEGIAAVEFKSGGASYQTKYIADSWPPPSLESGWEARMVWYEEDRKVSHLIDESHLDSIQTWLNLEDFRRD